LHITFDSANTYAVFTLPDALTAKYCRSNADATDCSNVY
jgi:hypothetical protein